MGAAFSHDEEYLSDEIAAGSRSQKLKNVHRWRPLFIYSLIKRHSIRFFLTSYLFSDS
jgi:hypothetical protein